MREQQINQINQINRTRMLITKPLTPHFHQQPLVHFVHNGYYVQISHIKHKRPIYGFNQFHRC